MTDRSTPRAKPSNRVLVIFGARGDLAARKLFPGLFRLYAAGRMPEDFRIIGSGRHSPGSDDDFRKQIGEAIEKFSSEELDGQWREFSDRLSFVVSNADDGSDLVGAVKNAEQEIDARGDRLIYLSVPPSATQDMVKMLGESGLADHCSLVVEKPFGHDVKSAKELNAVLHSVVDEDSIYRIDHFLGKEAAQNIMALRFANGLLEPIWTRDRISYVQIDVPEAIDIQGRGNFYEGTGAFQDMVVTHLLQILGVVAIEPPARIDGESVHIERTKLFEAVRPLDPADVVFGQYIGYRDEEGVADSSTVETFVALKVMIDNWRWSGVPFYLRTGKALGEGRRTVTIGFWDAPLRIFPDVDPDFSARPSELVFELSDDPQVSFELLTKIPGPSITLGKAALKLDVRDAFNRARSLEAYERLLHDVMLEEHLLFTTAEQIERLWEVCEPVIENPPGVIPYYKGTWGPREGVELVPYPGWRLPDKD